MGKCLSATLSLPPPEDKTATNYLERHGRNQKKKADHVHVHVYVNVYVNVHVDVDVDVVVNGSCHAKILSWTARIFTLIVRITRNRHTWVKGFRVIRGKVFLKAAPSWRG